MSGWRVEVTIPFDGLFSKNRVAVIRKVKRTGRRFVGKSDESRARQNALTLLVRAALNRARAEVVVDRLFLTIEVFKTDHRTDAVNVLDIVCDAVRDASGLDDRWFEVEGLRWEIVPKRPTLRVIAWQEDESMPRACGACERDLEHSAFGAGRGPRGRAWFCRECVKARRTR